MKRTKRKHISSFMAMILFAGTVTISAVPAETALAATDTYGHWAESTINKWTASGYITGYPDGTFRPNNAISRAEFVTLANKAFGYNVPASINFSDVNSSYWAYNEIQKGVSAGYIRGDAVGTFRPGAAVTRQEAAVMMSQIKKLQEDSNRAMNYTDYDSISNWAKPYVGAVSSVKIMQGFPNGAFRPQTSMTRAEAVTALENAIFAVPQVPSSNTTINPNPDTSVNNSPGSSFNTNTNSNTSSSSRPTDSEYTLEENTLRNRIISGDLIISDSLEGKTVTLMNVTVNGTVKVQGGSTIRVQSCDFNNVELDKSNVIFNSDSKSKIKSLTFLEKGKIEGTGYENVYVEDDSLSEATVDAEVNYLELDTDANLKLYKNAEVSTLEITSDAKDGEVTFTSGAKVEDMNIRGRIRISGRGDINDMTTYVSGVRSSIRPDNLTTRGDGEKPSYTSGERGHSSSSSSGSNYDDLTIDREDRRYDADGERYHNVTIEADGVEFRDATVYNRLTITRDVEDGEVIIEDVKVRGDVYIYGGGKNSVIFRDCDIQGDIISDKDIDSRYGEEPVALEFEDGTEVGDIRVRGETIIRAENGIKINTVTVDRVLDEELELDAAISTLNIYNDCDVRILGRSRINKVDVSSGRDVTFRMESGSQIDTLESKSDVVLRGIGTVKTIKTDKTISKDSGIVNDDQASTFVAVTNILGIPTTGITGTPLTLNPTVIPSNASYQTVKWTTDSGSIADDKTLTVQKDGTVHLTATIENGKEIGTAFTKNFTIVFSSNSGSDTPNPPTPTQKGSITSIEAANSVAQGGSLELTAKGSNLSGKTINWSISGNSTGTSLNQTTGEKVTLKVAANQATGKITVKAWVKDDQAEANAASKEITVTANSGGDNPSTTTAAVKGIKANAEATAATTVIPVMQGNTVSLTATGDNLTATGKTVNWEVEGTNLKTGGTGFQKTEGTNTTINKTATGTTATLVIATDETTGTENITVKAWASDQTEAVARKITVQPSPTAVTSVAVTGIIQNNVTPDINAAKKGDKFQATATLNHDLQPGETIKWSFKNNVDESVAKVDPKVENNITDTKVGIISINGQTSSEQTLTLQAKVVNGETTVSDAIEVEQKIKIASNSSSPESTTAVTEIRIEGIGNSILTNDCAMKGGQFKATATLNGELQDGESVDWSLEGNNINTLATITPNENNRKEATIEIKDQSTQEVPFIVKAQIKKDETIIANSAKTEKMYIAGTAETINIGIDASTPIIIHLDETINSTVGETLKVIARVSPENGDKTANIVLESSDTSKFTVDKISETNTFTLTPIAVGTATLTAKVDTIEVTRSVEVKSVPASQNEEQQPEEPAAQSDEPQAEATPARKSVLRAPAVPTVQEQPEEKPYVIDITLPTQEGEVGKNFDLSQANMEATGDFEIDWIVGRGFAETPDDHTVRMDRAGSVIMTAVVVGGQPDGEVYTKDFEITFKEPKEEAPVAPEEPKEETPVTPEEPKEEAPVTPEEPKEEAPVAPEEPKEEAPVTPEEPKEEAPVTPEEPKEETPVAPEEPKEEAPVTPKEPKEETPVTPEEPKEETPVTPEEPKEETPVAPEEPKEEAPVAPEEPKEETPVVPEEPKEETPVAPVQQEDENIVITTKGKLVVNGKITLFAKNKLGVDYTNAVWSIVDDGGTGAVLMSETPEEETAEKPTEITAAQDMVMIDISAPESQEDTTKIDDKKVPTKNILVAKKPGTITIKVTLGNDTTKVRTKTIIIP